MRTVIPLVRVAVVALFGLVAHASAQTVIEPTQLDPGARCEPFLATNVNCQGIVPVGASIYLNATTTQAGADAFAANQASAVPKPFSSIHGSSPCAAVISIVRNVDAACANALYPWMCALVFRPCQWQNFTTANDTLS